MAQASPHDNLLLILILMPLSRQFFFGGPVNLNIAEFQEITKGTHFLFLPISSHILSVHAR